MCRRVLFAVWLRGVNSACYDSFLFSWVFGIYECTQQMVFELRNFTLEEGKHQDKLVHSGRILR